MNNAEADNQWSANKCRDGAVFVPSYLVLHNVSKVHANTTFVYTVANRATRGVFNSKHKHLGAPSHIFNRSDSVDQVVLVNGVLLFAHDIVLIKKFDV